MGLIENIKHRMAELGISQHDLAKKSGVTQPSINRLLTGKVQKPRFLPDIANALNMSVEQLLGSPGRHNQTQQDQRQGIANLRLVGEVQAGVWQEAVEYPYDDQLSMPIPVGKRNHVDKLFLLKAKGDSMNQANMPDGSVLICMSMYDFTSYVRDIQDGDFVIAYRRDSHGIEATVKELQIKPDGSHWLWPRSDNPEFQAPIKIDPVSEWNDGAPHEVEIAAVVVGHFSLSLPTM